MAQLLDVAIDTKLKLCALWASIMFFLIFTEHFALFTPGTFEMMKSFRADPEHRDSLRAALLVMASPILMIFLSVALPAKYNRILNIVVGLSFVLFWALNTLVISMLASVANVTLPISAPKILQFAVAAFAALVVWYAWKWPKTQNAV
jgi:hypothetical protein